MAILKDASTSKYRVVLRCRNVESKKRGSEHTLSHLSGGVSARGALVLLDVQRTAA